MAAFPSLQFFPPSLPPSLPPSPDYTAYSMGAPAGGDTLLFSLNVLDSYGLSPLDGESNLTYHRMVEVFKFAFALRTQLGDPDCDQCDAGSVRAVEANMTRYTAAVYTHSCKHTRLYTCMPQLICAFILHSETHSHMNALIVFISMHTHTHTTHTYVLHTYTGYDVCVLTRSTHTSLI